MLKKILHTFMIGLSITMLFACSDHKKVAFTLPDAREKLHADLPWPDNSVVVLSYHDVEDGIADQRFVSVRSSALREQFAWLKENGYQPVSVDHIRAAHRGEKPLPKKAVLLTFDDGFSSFYTRVYPLLKAYGWPALWAPVGSWVDTPANQKVKFGDEFIDREKFATWQQIQELAKSPLVEVGAHTWNSHYGALGNSAGGMYPVMANRRYNPATSSYETESEYRQRVRADGEKITQYLKKYTGKQPKSWVWPYGAENGVAIQELKKIGYDMFFTLGDGLATPNKLDAVPRILVGENPTINEFASLVGSVQKKDDMRSININIDSIYSSDKNQLDRNVDNLIQRVKDMKVTAVYLQGFVTPGMDGRVKEVYFRNRLLPVRSDLFGRIAWQLKTRADVRVYAIMPVLNWDFNRSPDLVAQENSASAPGMAVDSDNKQQQATDSQIWRNVHNMYEDLAATSAFDGVLFMDEKMMQGNGSADKHALESLRSSLANTVKSVRGPSLQTARYIVATPGIEPASDATFVRSIQESLRTYDWTVIIASPDAVKTSKKQQDVWLKELANYIATLPGANEKVSVQLETQPAQQSGTNAVDVDVISHWMEILQLNGVKNYGYNPRNNSLDKKQVQVISPELSTEWYPENE